MTNCKYILHSLKNQLGIPETLVGDDGYAPFDAVLIMDVNAVFMTLNQLGVGPSEGFAITDGTFDILWTDFMPEGPLLEAVKTYMYLKVKLMFDPPTNSAVTDAINRNIAELEWRLNVAADTPKTSEEGESQNE